MNQEFQQQPMGQQGGRSQQPMTEQMGGHGQEMDAMQGQQPTTGGMQQSRQPMTGEMGGQQPQMGGEMHGRSQQMGGGMQHVPQFEDHLTPELRTALEDFDYLTHVAEWCAVECTKAGPQLADCARICEDVAELAELNEKLIARNSMFGPEIAEAFVRVAQEGIREIQQYQQSHPHVEETVAAIDRAIDSCTRLLQLVGGQGHQPPMGGMQGHQQPTSGGMQQGHQRPMTEQMGGQQMGGM